MQIHPELAAVLDLFKDAPPMDFVTTPVPEIRKLMEHMAFPPADLPMHELRALSIPGGAGQPMQARLYRPTAAPKAPVMVFFHFTMMPAPNFAGLRRSPIQQVYQ